MEIFFIVLSVIVGLFVLFYLTIFAFAFYVHRRFFHRRYNGNKYLKYFKADDFYGLKTETISFQSDVGQYIHGYIYSYDQVKKPYGLIIFSHGFGAGHEAYTTEINTFAKAGFYVLAYDGTGCVGSEGKYFRGFDQGPIDLMSAYRFAESDPRLKDLRKIFVGHSWGAFSVMNAQLRANVCGAVAMCGFVSSAEIVAQTAIHRCRVLRKIFSDILRLLNRFEFGKNANQSCLDSLKDSNKPIFLLYGEKDQTVLYRYNGAFLKNKLGDKKNIRFCSFKEKGHNVYLTVEAEEYMNNTFAQIAQKIKLDPGCARELYNQVDYEKMTAEDPAIMGIIIDFCKKIVA